MRKGFAFIPIVAVIGLLLIAGGGLAIAKNFSFLEGPRKFGQGFNLGNFGKIKIKPETPSAKPSETPFKSPPTAAKSPTASPNTKENPSQAPSPSPSGTQTVYKQPQGKYTLTLPAGWSVGKTTAAAAYSTTIFTGPNGNISITFGSGKDPIGGCSETNNIELADRTISGCYLLQKDGSQLLTRTYTKDKTGIEFTIEAYINTPLSSNKPVILSIIKTIDIE